MSSGLDLHDRLPGRADLLAQVWGHLRAGNRVLVEGPAGIGKSALLAAVADLAAQDDWLVLTAAPSEVEQFLPYAVLMDLFQPAADLASGLSSAEQEAVTAVLEGSSESTLGDRTVAAATRALLHLASVKYERVLLLLDDVAWLDPASARALEYALRRVPVPVVVARRTEDAPSSAPLSLDRPVTGAPLETVVVGPLDRPTLRDAVGRVAGALPRHLRERILDEADGNVLLALELARAVLRMERVPLAIEDLPVVGSSILEIARTAVDALPGASVRALRLAALTTTPRLEMLAAAGVTPEDWAPAEEAGLVRLAEGAVRFRHPMYAAAVRTAVGPGERRRLHAELARAVDDPDERARQLARAVTGHDPEVAAELDRAARRQVRRGALEAARALWLRAAELETDADARNRYLAEVGETYFATGDHPAAFEVASRVMTEADGEAKAISLLTVASVVFSGYDAPDVNPVQYCEEAVALAPEGSRARAGAHLNLCIISKDPSEALRHAQEALRSLDVEDPDRTALAGALFCKFDAAARLGVYDTAVLERGLRLEEGLAAEFEGNLPGRWWRAIDEHELARQRFRFTREAYEYDGDDFAVQQSVRHLAVTELFAARLDASEEALAESYRFAEQFGTSTYQDDWIAARIAATRGHLDEADRILAPSREIKDRRFHTRLHHYDTNAFVEWCAGNHAEVVRWCRAVQAELDAWEGLEQWLVRHEPLWLDAAIAVGDLDEAAEALRLLQVRHDRLPRPWTRLGLPRCRLLLAAASGEDVAGPLADLTTALEEVPADRVPLERGLALTVAGATHRRLKHRALARDRLTEAAALFEQIGAPTLQARVAEELARIGGRSASTTLLSETERRVAELAAEGRTNVEIAATLFLSPKTVEANLSRVYRKLGIRGRVEIGRALAEAEEA